VFFIYTFSTHNSSAIIYSFICVGALSYSVVWLAMMQQQEGHWLPACTTQPPRNGVGARSRMIVPWGEVLTRERANQTLYMEFHPWVSTGAAHQYLCHVTSYLGLLFNYLTRVLRIDHILHYYYYNINTHVIYQIKIQNRLCSWAIVSIIIII
jgi:hypothetical protein